MPQLLPLTINDGATTPVAHTFNPVGIDSEGVARFRETATVAIGDSFITVKRSTSGTKDKVRVVLSRPVVVSETINGVDVPKLERIAFGEFTLSFDRTSTSKERDDLAAMMANALQHSVMQQVIVDREHFY